MKNSKWVCSLKKFFCSIVGFPIVKHEAQCLALFRLLEQDCIEVRVFVWVLLIRLVSVFLTFYLLMIPFFSVMPLKSRFFLLGWF